MFILIYGYMTDLDFRKSFKISMKLIDFIEKTGSKCLVNGHPTIRIQLGL